MFISVKWGIQYPDGPYQHMYQCSDYSVSRRTDQESYGPTGPAQYVQICMDNGKHEVALSAGDKAYVMNDDGKTIDTIVV